MKFKSDIQAESKVGIGTDTVNYPLDVRAGSANSDIAQFTGANDSRGLKISTFQRFTSDDSVDYDCQFSGAAPILPAGAQTWSMSGNEKMRLTQDGTLGIGTTSPIDPLVVRNGTSDTSVKILSFNNTTGTEATLKFSTFASETNHVKAAIIARNAAGSFGRSDMHFALDSAADISNVQFSDTKMTILNSGNVGIGTTGPDSKLEVAGEIDATTGDGYKINGKPWANESASILKLGDWDGEGFSTSIFDNNSTNIVTIKDYGTMINCSSLVASYGSNASLAVGTVGNESAGAAVITLANNDTTTSAGDPTGTIQFAIKADNNAATLGYTSAVIQGSIFSSAGTGNSGGGILDFKTSPSVTGNSPQTRMRINQEGDVGIGTTSPQEKLHVMEEVEGNTLIEVENTRGNSTAGVKLSSGQTNFNIAYTNANGDFQIYNRATNRIEFHIGANGSVGIDTVNPTAGTKLDVAGSVKAERYINQRVAWNVGFNHGSNNTASYYFIPVGYLSATTGNTYYNNWIAPYAGRVKKIVMRNTGTSTVPTATTVNFRVSVNGSVVYTGSTITVTGSGLNILASQTLSDTNAVFSATDRVQVAYRTNGLWRNAATGISLEYTE